MKARALNYAGIAAGTLISAFGLNFFLIPNRLNDGGITGVAIVLHYLIHLPVGPLSLLLNVPLFGLSFWLLGRTFGVRSVFGMVALAFFLTVLPIHPLASDPLLATVYGGLFSGTGLGIAFRLGGSTGGSDLLGRLLRHFTHISLGQAMLAIDAAVVILTGLAFGPRLAMYSLFALFIGTRVIDLVEEGIDVQRAAIIMVRDPQALAAILMSELGRGVTSLSGRGMYTEEDRPVLLAVVARAEVPRLKRLVYGHDPTAFLVITKAHEVLGEGFKNLDADLTVARPKKPPSEPR